MMKRVIYEAVPRSAERGFCISKQYTKIMCSFVGDYTNEDTRKEGSPYGTQIEEIRYLRKEYFGHE